MRVHEKLGFQQEGWIRRTELTEGALHDKLIYGISAEEFGARGVVTG